MTDAKRRDRILRLIREDTARNTKSAATARRSLIATGIYTKKGELTPEFGGPRKERAKA